MNEGKVFSNLLSFKYLISSFERMVLMNTKILRHVFNILFEVNFDFFGRDIFLSLTLYSMGFLMFTLPCSLILPLISKCDESVWFFSLNAENCLGYKLQL